MPEPMMIRTFLTRNATRIATAAAQICGLRQERTTAPCQVRVSGMMIADRTAAGTYRSARMNHSGAVILPNR